MKLSEKTFQVLDTLDRKIISTQRELSQHAGVSLGQVNYILKGLLDKGLVKIGNFRKNPKKISYAYLLTPKGIEAKSRLAVNFVLAKLREYDLLKTRLSERLGLIVKKKQQRIIFVGPQKVKDFIDSIIQDENLNLVMVKHCFDLSDLTRVKPNSFETVLLFDGSEAIRQKTGKMTGIPGDKIISLW